MLFESSDNSNIDPIFPVGRHIAYPEIPCFASKWQKMVDELNDKSHVLKIESVSMLQTRILMSILFQYGRYDFVLKRLQAAKRCFGE